MQNGSQMFVYSKSLANNQTDVLYNLCVEPDNIQNKAVYEELYDNPIKHCDVETTGNTGCLPDDSKEEKLSDCKSNCENTMKLNNLPVLQEYIVATQ